MKPVTEVILSAAFALTPEENWTTRNMARDARGYSVSPLDPDAACFCVAGAFEAAAGGGGQLYREACGYFSRATGWNLVGSWNDDADRTHAEVLAALYKAAELSEAS